MTLLLSAFEHRNYRYWCRWAVPILIETWPWLQHHVNTSLLALQKAAGKQTRTCFPGSLLTSCFCSHPETGSGKQTKTFIWTLWAVCIIIFFTLKKNSTSDNRFFISIHTACQPLPSASIIPADLGRLAVWIAVLPPHNSTCSHLFVVSHWIVMTFAATGDTSCMSPTAGWHRLDSTDSCALSVQLFQHNCSQFSIRREWRGKQQEVLMSRK